MEKYLGKYRVASARAPFWDYGWEGAYFVTPCAANRECIFGAIVRDESGKAFLQPSFLGEIVLLEWAKSFVMRPELQCDIFQLMPNHLHAILRIIKEESDVGAAVLPLSKDACHASLHRPGLGVAYRSPKSISSFIGGFKSAVTSSLNNHLGTTGKTVWQPRFHDHVIRNNREYNYIFHYVENNPDNWLRDGFYR